MSEFFSIMKVSLSTYKEVYNNLMSMYTKRQRIIQHIQFILGNTILVLFVNKMRKERKQGMLHLTKVYFRWATFSSLIGLVSTALMYSSKSDVEEMLAEDTDSNE